jgi:hypothetical protein
MSIGRVPTANSSRDGKGSKRQIAKRRAGHPAQQPDQRALGHKDEDHEPRPAPIARMIPISGRRR